MSIKTFIADLKGAEHTFVAYFEKTAIAVEKAAPGVERVIAACLGYATPMLDLALAAVPGGAAAIPEATAIVQEAKDALTVASSVVYDAGPTPTGASLFTSVATNLNGLLTASHVTNPASVAAVNKVVANITAVAGAIETAAAGIAAAAPPAPAPAP